MQSGAHTDDCSFILQLFTIHPLWGLRTGDRTVNQKAWETLPSCSLGSTCGD